MVETAKYPESSHASLRRNQGGKRLLSALTPITEEKKIPLPTPVFQEVDPSKDEGFMRITSEMKIFYGIWSQRFKEKSTHLSFDEWLRTNNIFNSVLPR